MAEPNTAAGKRSAESVLGDDDVNVWLDGVHVTYRIYEDRPLRLQDLARGKKRQYREIKAVRGVDLVARRGETIGIIGRNGSGKSTLLQALSGLLPVDAGEVYARSQPTLLGVGTALQPNLSGRRNVELGCLALGMKGKEVEEAMPRVLEYAGVEDFADLPLRAYSSGMRARLLFSIATTVIPDILVIDEALAVGDEEFRDKSRSRINELRENAGTVFLVSHALDTILDTCNRVIWLHEGRIRADGDPQEVVDEYKSDVERRRKAG
ncbi:MAG TPA: ABC transporter ATP-binding protein [Egicoccus sp.]|nr:ABC transporter ATP-binding protein [Egicoccus sp.]HSK22601.1 ABC transporter ATP-binding protein [Egicoccus sp.]